MANVHRTIIVPAALVEKGKKIASLIDMHGEGMFTTALSPSGNLPATHYVSCGVLDEQFAATMEDGAMMDAAVTQGSAKQGKTKDTSKKDCDDLIAGSVVHKGIKNIEGNDVVEGPHELFARLGLKIINPTV